MSLSSYIVKFLSSFLPEGNVYLSTFSRKILPQIPWKVPTHMYLTVFSPIMLPRRAFISFAALLVNVTARIFCGLTPFCIKYAIREVRTFVFPLPAPASINSGPAVVCTASFCSLLRFSNIFSISLFPKLKFYVIISIIEKNFYFNY